MCELVVACLCHSLFRYGNILKGSVVACFSDLTLLDVEEMYKITDTLM